MEIEYLAKLGSWKVKNKKINDDKFDFYLKM